MRNGILTTVSSVVAGEGIWNIFSGQFKRYNNRSNVLARSVGTYMKVALVYESEGMA